MQTSARNLNQKNTMRNTHTTIHNSFANVYGSKNNHTCTPTHIFSIVHGSREISNKYMIMLIQHCYFRVFEL